MHERERWQSILRIIAGRPVTPVRDIAIKLDTSPATLRRDLARLAERGLLRRVHGGVEPVEPGERPQLATRAFDVSRTLNAAKKRAIARAAAALCKDGESIIINAGTTTFHMVEFLADKRLQILTNSFPIAEALVGTPGNRITLPGGEIYREQGIILSPFDDDATQHNTAAKMFMSCLSLGPLGVVEGDPLIARAEAKLLDRAADLVLLVDSSKFEPRGSLVVAPVSRLKTVITDDEIPKGARDMLASAGVETIIVPIDENLQSVA